MRRHLWTGAGLFFVGVGAVGAFLPLLPTVPFLLLALFCFARGNPVWEQRLLAHPKYGPLLLDWRQRRAIPRRAKWAALIAMAVSVLVTGMTAGWPWVLIPVAVMALSGTWIWTRNE
ncbi:MAG: YbaN family protein [Novosphingobium sp.]|uniref:YbaN family protein n=1 Tax=Novosphingobium sp. NDB2Meth1 TaxID=1892847 RepID=UPI0009315BA5|nr:YbaN family protein [Novosphingobium sp. NDB2Meth1]MBY0393056.1 YbaN family protein [Novosphingobium sp.]